MFNDTLYQDILTLPDELKSDVQNYVEFLKYKNNIGNPKPSFPEGKRPAGLAKGMIWIADDFDNELEDFAEYMP